MHTFLPPADDTHHPAPARHDVSLLSLVFALLGAPVAWSLQLLVNYALASHACYPHETPLATPLWTSLWPILLSVSVLAIAIGTVTAVIAWRNWQKVQHEHIGEEHHLLEVGEGRTRFLAMCGLLTSGMFLLALVFTTINLWLVPLCG